MHDLRHPSSLLPPRRSSRVAVIKLLSLACTLLGALSLLGWIPGAQWLLFDNGMFDAPRPSRALLLLISGMSLAFAAEGRDRLAARTAQATVGFAVLLLGVSVAGNAFFLDPLLMRAAARPAVGPGIVSEVQAVLALLVSAGVLLLVRFPISPRRILIGTAIGMLLVGSGLLLAIMHAARLTSPDSWLAGPLSFASIVSALLQGVALFLLVADRQETPRVPPRWSPEMAAGLAVLCSMALWRAFGLQLDMQSVQSQALPTLALVLGLGVSGLVYLSLHLLRSNWEQAQRMAHANLSRALETATDGVWEYDGPSQTMQRSEQQLRHLGYPPAAVNGVSGAWLSLIHEADQQRVVEYERELRLSTRDECELTYRIRASDGSYHTIIDRGRVVERMANGEPRSTIGISADVTERIAADRARRDSERRFRAIFDSALQGQVLLDARGTCLEVNCTALSIVGGHRDDVLRASLVAGPWFTGLPEAQQTVELYLERALGGEAVRFEAETHLIDGRIGLLECSMAPLACDAGRVEQVLCEMRDVTERRRSEEALREIGALTTIGRLSARVAHEINNPLAGIQNAFLLLGDAVPLDHPHRRFLQSIDREIQRIASVTRSLYETYRHDSSPDAAGSMSLAVHDAVTFLDQVNRSRGIRITTDLRRAPQLVPVPDALLRQTLYNLVQNAVEASPSGGEVAIVVTTEGDSCVITVRDEGARIPDHLRERIFQPMSDVRSSVTRTGSMGIGLSLVRQSVKALGGTVTLLDSADHGATFEVRLPMTSILQPHVTPVSGTPTARTSIRSTP